MNLPQIQDSVKRTICSDVAMRLGSRHGRRPTYTPEEVATAMRECRLPRNWDIWAVAVFCAKPAYDAFAAATGVAADQAAVRSDIARFAPQAKPLVPPPLGDEERSPSKLPDLLEVAVDLGGDAVDLVGSIFEALD